MSKNHCGRWGTTQSGFYFQKCFIPEGLHSSHLGDLYSFDEKIDFNRWGRSSIQYKRVQFNIH